MKTNIEESYILREYYKGFRPEQVDLIKIKEKINKINRESILSYVIEQDKQIYNLIAENYQNTYEILDKITDHINSLNLIKKAKTAKSSDNLFYMVRYNSDDEDKTNNTTITSNNDFCTEPIAVIKINGILNQNQNKIQEYSNEMTARKNVIKKKEKIIEEKNKYLDEIVKEKEFFIENLEDNFEIANIISNLQFELLFLLFTKFVIIPDREVNGDSERELSIEEKKFLIIQAFNKKSKKEIRKILSTIDEDKCIHYSYDELNLIKKQIDEIIRQMNENENENDYYYFLAKAMRSIIDVTNVKNEIIIEQELIREEEKMISELEVKVKELNLKIKSFESAKKEILSKYEKSGSQPKIKRQLTNTSVKSTNSKNTSLINKESDSNKEDINELKLLISQMENNYVSLLKNLSKKIIKPKNLIRKPDPNFLQSKIK